MSASMPPQRESIPLARGPGAAGSEMAVWRHYFALTKPRVIALIIFTAIVGTLLAAPGIPPLDALVWGTLGIALASASAAALNHVLDRRIDVQMTRTRGRPLPRGKLTERQALVFAGVLGFASMAILGFLVNLLTAALT
ncbi:MAG: UbiA family prenyltransferase, partial [Steroidobacteraceae bacterium]